VLQCILGNTLCLDPKVAGVRNSDIFVLFFFLRRDIPVALNRSQVYIKTVTLSVRFYQFSSRLQVSAVTVGHHHA